MYKKGFTLIELIIVFAVLAILAAVAVPVFTGLIDEAKESADNASLTMLNRTTAAYAALKSQEGDAFPGLTTNAQRIQALIDEQLLSSPIIPQQQDVSFSWDTGEQKWQLSVS